MSLYYACEVLPQHRAWGLYTRAAAAGPFWLSVITFSHEKAVAQGTALKMINPRTHYAVHGAVTATELPEKIIP